MNNETNKQVETFEKNFFDWLLSKPSSEEILEVGENQKPIKDMEAEIRGQEEWEEFDPLDSEEIDFPYDNESPPMTLGEVPTVYNRFESLLQKRLKAKIEAKPPIFPWEESGYNTDYPDVEVPDLVPPIRLWASQMKNIRWGNLSIPLTDSVFAQILQSCQEIVQSNLLPGSRLVKAVDNLFPGQSQSLNNLAGLVLAGPPRGVLPGQVTTYNSATPNQQMLLSLLAAEEILSSLTLTCHLNQAVERRQWETAVGWINIEAEYSIPKDRSCACLRIKGQLPAAGSLKLQGGESYQTTAQRSDAGILWVELFAPKPDQKLQLTINLLNGEEPLNFAVCLQPNSKS
ncbi:MAG: hypothetical protein F6K22_08020 [Okeania sp. SIO2F4]|uniref:hypothetical protein n=1 Tax=Okeania sp. SIO2F4 TaxID=2607790 RepID=UPI00142A8467|nr:hypothetical protein [Okeania sp. SIO2F4]NES02797.1 hypothetical protein [Okeania sp. SIO2F4]